MVEKKKSPVCDICSGSGQVSFFKGVSRFLLSTEECVACGGTGLKLDDAEAKTASDKNSKAGRK